jgi:hypothetical protein
MSTRLLPSYPYKSVQYSYSIGLFLSNDLTFSSTEFEPAVTASALRR